jgi:hypothetical protein
MISRGWAFSNGTMQVGATHARGLHSDDQAEHFCSRVQKVDATVSPIHYLMHGKEQNPSWRLLIKFVTAAISQQKGRERRGAREGGGEEGEREGRVGGR